VEARASSSFGRGVSVLHVEGARASCTLSLSRVGAN
jgi:hypothetical protein